MALFLYFFVFLCFILPFFTASLIYVLCWSATKQCFEASASLQSNSGPRHKVAKCQIFHTNKKMNSAFVPLGQICLHFFILPQWLVQTRIRCSDPNNLGFLARYAEQLKIALKCQIGPRLDRWTIQFSGKRFNVCIIESDLWQIGIYNWQTHEGWNSESNYQGFYLIFVSF